jgi:hypothetical protein
VRICRSSSWSKSQPLPPPLVTVAR